MPKTWVTGLVDFGLRTEAQFQPSGAHDQCQCPDASYDHEPGQCDGVGDAHVMRDGQDIWVCNQCTLSSDEQLAEAKKLTEDDKKFNTVYGPPQSEYLRKKNINDYFGHIGGIYHEKIPLSDIFNVLRVNGYQAVQEDGTPWSGFLTGAEGRASIELIDLSKGKPAKKWLQLTWYRMTSGRYEVVAYLN